MAFGLQLLRRAGLRPAEDGWRRAARALCRDEETKFTIAAFGVAVPATEEELADDLGEFLRGEPELYRRLDWTPLQVRIRKTEHLDLAIARFSSDGSLRAIHLMPDGRQPLPSSLTGSVLAELEECFVGHYERTRSLPDRRRPAALQRRLLDSGSWSGSLLLSRLSPAAVKDARSYLDRLFTAVIVCFEDRQSRPQEPGHAGDRLALPQFLHCKHPGGGPLTVLCRTASDSSLGPPKTVADLWFHANHAAIDGAPLQDIIVRIRTGWGVRMPLIVPSEDVNRWSPLLRCSTPPPRGKALDRPGAHPRHEPSYVTHAFLDLQPVLHARRALNVRFADSPGTPVTVAGMLAWGVEQHPAFRGRKFQIPTDVAATGDRERALGPTFVRPAAYRSGERRQAGSASTDEGVSRDDRNWRAFLAFQRDLKEQQAAAKTRRSEGYEMIESFALTPAPLHVATLRVLGAGVRELAGSMSLTVLRDVELFLTALDARNTDGSFSFGSFLVPAADGRLVASVSVKGSRRRVEEAQAAIESMRRLWARCAAEERNGTMA